MPRYKLKEARIQAKLSQSAFADLVGAERKAVNYWERGTQEPRDCYRQEIRKKLNNNDPELFTNYPEGAYPPGCTISSATDSCPQLQGLIRTLLQILLYKQILCKSLLQTAILILWNVKPTASKLYTLGDFQATETSLQ